MHNAHRVSRRTSAIMAAAVLASTSMPLLAVTQTATWSGPAGGNWNDASHWSPSGVPNNGTNGVNDYNVVISSNALLDINATIDSLTVNSGAQLTINPTLTLSVAGPTVTNNGVIQVDSLSQNAALKFTANTALNGSGAILLDDYNPSAVLTASAGVTITQASTHTIHGVGDITGALVNNGTVNADFGGHTITLATANMTNNKLFEATNTGTLAINGITVTQGAAGQIFAGADSSVTLSGATINGGTLNSATGRAITVADNSTFNNITVGTGAMVQIEPAKTLNISGTTLVNNGLIRIDRESSSGTLNFTSSIALSGSGSIFVDDWSPNAAITGAASAVVTQAASHTIYGIGEIDASLVNNGVVNASINYGSRTLVLQTNAKTNNNLFEATGGGILSINGITVTQGAAGKILADATSSVSVTNATIVGGALNATAGGVFNVSNSTFNAVTIGANNLVVIQPATVLNISGGTLVNNGLIQVDTFSSSASLNFTANTALSGNGNIFLDDYSPNAAITAPAGVTITQAGTHAIYGNGEVDAALINNGVVNANDTRGPRTLYLQTNAKTNNNLFEATGGGILNINGITVTQSSTGFISVDNNANSSVILTNNAKLSGGKINGPGVVSISNGTLSGVTITTGANVTVTNAGTATLNAGTINNGTLSINGPTSLVGLTGSGALSAEYPGVATLPLGSGQSAQKSVALGTFGVLDITNNSFAVNYGTGNASPLVALRAYLHSGYASGAWTGYGIISSKAAATPGYGIAYADGTNGATAGQVLLKYARAGDSNLDGHVNFDDLITLAQHYNTTTGTAVYTQGDFTYDGNVNFDDLIVLAQNYNTTFTPVQAAELGSDFMGDFALARSLVPEPTTLSTLAAAGLLAAGRSRARRR